MAEGRTGRSARWVVASLFAMLGSSLQAAPPVHVMVRGEAADPGVAYVVLVPHMLVMGQARDYVTGVISGTTPDGQSREYTFGVPADRPTAIRVAPGRYHLSELVINAYRWSFGDDETMFDAKAGQLNYPGDWMLDVEHHDIMRGARKIGWRIDPSLATSEVAVDISRLDVDPEFTAAMKAVYTRVERLAHPNGVGDR